MPLRIRLAEASDQEFLTAMVLDSFEPITWQKKLDESLGALNDCDWRERWRLRLANIFATQVVLVGEFDEQLAALATATIDHRTALAFLDVLAVGRTYQGRGFGRELLRGAIDHYRTLGCKYVHLDCLSDNDIGNALYASEGFREVARHIRWFKEL